VSEWFERWFGDDYLELYPHRDDAEAVKAVALLATHGVVRAGERVLDLACGAGRHSAALAAAGTEVTGLDLSLPLLKAARKRGITAPLVRGDMRCLPIRDGSFDAVVNLFTSFGYFDDDGDHDLALREVARVLRPGGRFALDFLNAPAVRAGLVQRDEKQLGKRRVVQERRISEGGRSVIKTINLVDEDRSFIEQVRLFERAELEAMLARAGLRVSSVFGDYGGGPHSAASSRLILLAIRG
jgi:ubiquinone/menaquinone biosynthesis C-methylase UbiE